MDQPFIMIMPLQFLIRAACVPAAALALALTFPASIEAQSPSLADLARKEQARRKELTVPAKVFTKDDLPASAVIPPAAAAPAAAAPAAAPAVAAAPGDPKTDAPEDEKKGEEWWRQRMAQVREELRRNELFAEALQSRMNALAADVASRDDPAQRQALGEERQKAVQEFARVQASIEASKKQLAGIEEEARLAGVPPGWVR